jgi:hypothetical protein
MNSSRICIKYDADFERCCKRDTSPIPIHVSFTEYDKYDPGFEIVHVKKCTESIVLPGEASKEGCPILRSHPQSGVLGVVLELYDVGYQEISPIPCYRHNLQNISHHSCTLCRLIGGTVLKKICFYTTEKKHYFEINSL